MVWIKNLFYVLKTFFFKLKANLLSYCRSLSFSWASLSKEARGDTVDGKLLVSGLSNGFMTLTLFPSNLCFSSGSLYASMCAQLTSIVCSYPSVYIVVKIVGKSSDGKELHSSLPSKKKIMCSNVSLFVSDLSLFIDSFKNKYGLFKIDCVHLKLYIPSKN